MKDYYVKFNKKHSQMNVKLIQQASPEDFKKYSKLYNYNKETAELLEKVFFSPENIEILQHRIIDYVYELDDTLSKVVLVGHNPAFTLAANTLGKLSLNNISTACWVRIKFIESCWAEVNKVKNFEKSKRIQ